VVRHRGTGRHGPFRDAPPGGPAAPHRPGSSRRPARLSPELIALVDYPAIPTIGALSTMDPVDP
jgi:hypothetical protein